MQSKEISIFTDYTVKQGSIISKNLPSFVALNYRVHSTALISSPLFSDMESLGFASGLPIIGARTFNHSSKCNLRPTLRASATVPSTTTATDAASKSVAANAGTLATDDNNVEVTSMGVGGQLELGEVTSLADVDAIVQLADEFDLGDLKIESGGVSIEITRAGGLGFADGVLRDPPAPPTTTQVVQPATENGAVSEGLQADIEALLASEDPADDEEPASELSISEDDESTELDPNMVYDSDFVVKSNRVGFFFSGARNKPPLVNVEDHVAFNQPVCIIEQLGQQYVYLSEVSGTVTKIFVEDGDAVQYDDQVMVIRPD